MADIVISGLQKRYGGFTAIADLSLTIAEGEMLTLLGPSGCGKSTTLAALAGLDTPTAGQIRVGDHVYFDGQNGINLPPERRDCGMVFQSYALWPHMTVEANCAYPLRLRKVPAKERRDRVVEALQLVEMDHLLTRYPHELSGGQQQRVALARTLVFRPKLLLLDEPLSNLDARLRARARDWLMSLQRRIGLTTVFVTHDQIEALSMSDRIAVMDRGRIVQLDTPRAVYERPANRFVADFIGEMNFIAGQLPSGGDRIMLSDGQQIAVPPHLVGHHDGAVVLAIRPSRLAPGNGGLSATVTGCTYLGEGYSCTAQLAGQEIRIESRIALPSGPISLVPDLEGAAVFADTDEGRVA